ncbi:hypothetical protein PoB_006388800 [Plakobranchus ocellatus]|uniref:Uncharacterized protein n=1 Tax=Plakobranchus ocellatus TaxID=259542 RepID=A0AAV4CZS1_9GAST|nr:hypothetical protein PoB_006388800 [Plakobranchus ocellatus]
MKVAMMMMIMRRRRRRRKEKNIWTFSAKRFCPRRQTDKPEDHNPSRSPRNAVYVAEAQSALAGGGEASLEALLEEQAMPIIQSHRPETATLGF